MALVEVTVKLSGFTLQVLEDAQGYQTHLSQDGPSGSTITNEYMNKPQPETTDLQPRKSADFYTAGVAVFAVALIQEELRRKGVSAGA